MDDGDDAYEALAAELREHGVDCRSPRDAKVRALAEAYGATSQARESFVLRCWLRRLAAAFQR